MVISRMVKKIFGSRNERLLNSYRKIVAEINKYGESLTSLSDEELSSKTKDFKSRLESGATLDDILPEAFAVVREASWRTLKKRHYDVQLIGGIALHNGKIAEMRTGEGKTLVATLPTYLNALSGKGVHVVTVNDYLAKRDSEWMSPLYNFLGLSVGVIISDMSNEDRKQAYASDITYGTNNEFGFDYLRDNMAFSREQRVQRELNYAVIDEVDSILIDEARTPLIISGVDQDSSALYMTIDQVIPHLSPEKEVAGEAVPGDYTLDEKNKQVYLTEEGHQKVESILSKMGLLAEGASLYDAKHITLMHHVYAALKAHVLFKKDVDYIVQDNQVIIVDEHTGRTMPGRRWSDGLHQAVEAKEKTKVQNESQTLASITFQNFFRLYNKISGMTGTADTEAYELQQIYGLEVVVIPTNRPSARTDHEDVIYATIKDKYDAIITEILQCVERKQPVLVGTVAIESSEYLSNILNKKGIKHQVLNAKFHEKEADIIAEAGRPGAVTIATNMAGRGTDIVLGGKEEDTDEWRERHEAVLKAGGLHIIGTERHESRRIDNQLRGRAGRQGDPGSSKFYLSLQDNLLRIFISDRIKGFLVKLGLTEGESIAHPWLNNAIEKAQRKVEGHHFDIRKQLLDYDDVANQQRKVIYTQRKNILESSDIKEAIDNIIEEVIPKFVSEYIPENTLHEEWNIDALQQALKSEFNLDVNIHKLVDDNLSAEDIQAEILKQFKDFYKQKEENIGEATLRNLEKVILLNVLDNLWKEHLATLDYLRQSIHLRGYAQKDPKQEYKQESFVLFSNMLDLINRETISTLAIMQVKDKKEVEDLEIEQQKQQEDMKLTYKHEDIHENLSDEEREMLKNQNITYVREGQKVGRNDPCECGSGKKYKHCHGKI